MADQTTAPPPANGHTLERDFSKSANNPYHLGEHTDPEEALSRMRTAGSISISPELFEKLYLSPQNQVKGDLRKTFGNPTPIALGGFLLSLTPLACILMGWRGSGQSGAANDATYYFMGGMLEIIGGVLEFILGNTFPSVVFCVFGAFWLSFGGVLQPFYNSYGAYAPAGEPAAAGLGTQEFNVSFGFWLLWMGFLSFVFLLCALRTNFCFVVIFLTLTLGFAVLTAGYWELALVAQGNVGAAATANRYIITAGALFFVTCVSGWWIFAAIILASVDFPLSLPVGDLSTVFKGASDRAKLKAAGKEEV